MQPAWQTGDLRTWNDDRGFGFIKASDGGKDIFLHISKMDRRVRRPRVGDVIVYQQATDATGKRQATQAYIRGVAPPPAPPDYRGLWSGVKGVFALCLLGGAVSGLVQFSQQSKSPTFRPSEPYRGSASWSQDAPQSASAPPPGHTIKGNISVTSGARLYHLPGMRDYAETKVDVARGERWFRTEAEAQSAGWRRAPF